MASAPDIKPVPSLEEMKRRRDFFAKHWDELLEQYGEKFVAVKDDEVIASSGDLFELVHELERRGLSPRRDVAIEFITPHSDRLLL
ncbi:MAG TPA: DUF5678 domain-containing protein [Tepidiformaceae bacterium]|nr:DUF5678 domain-containing protein [Tepidiformaceae bacterium]